MNEVEESRLKELMNRIPLDFRRRFCVISCPQIRQRWKRGLFASKEDSSCILIKIS